MKIATTIVIFTVKILLGFSFQDLQESQFLAFSPDRSGILCFFSLKKQRYSGEQDDAHKRAHSFRS